VSLPPSAADPLRIAALAARADGEAEVACSLLLDAAQLDPADANVQFDLAEIHLDLEHVDAAQAILDALEGKAGDVVRVRALQARGRLIAAGQSADPASLQARIDANLDDFDARLRMANALALTRDYRPALHLLLELVRRDRKWQDEAARKAMLDLFTLLGSEPRYDDMVREFRILLARALN